MDNKELFKGFDYDKMLEEQKQYEDEVKQRWGNTDAYKVSKQRASKMLYNFTAKIMNNK